ncbi:ABC transporter ATP-binding protein [Paenibacillus sacheonensis]|uniref:ATP-binding cassette domain-containing protein n=1 Tax=Paenibacillus sacheonensis TaxID=742054 RepID=A0A7X5BXH8_9BACL|nr:ABC transporter ATP-binding protein [Paenibacillus sacheonensis]MBM7566079.1 ABC-2 type transport system ATP-binding protein [Paenibacillus sacheonensis]NBC68612.1 ATP-binding cassette domain-containing protein [Paenibacillus sacheonensis]
MNALSLEQVFKQYGDKTAVNGISFDVAPGEIYGLLGANGAGKTTTMRMVLGLIYPDSGRILYNGKAYSKEQLHGLGYLPEERGLYPKVKVSDQILYLAQLRGMSRKDADQNLKRWLDRFGVPEYYNKRVEELSKGNQQKIQFIAAVIHSPRIVIMDEAFSGLDPVNVELLKSTVKELRDAGSSILFSTHRMEHVEELCRNITILHKSNPVLQGNLKAIKQQFPRERIILGTDGEVNGLETLGGVLSVNRHEYGYELMIADEAAGRPILEKAMTQTEVRRFEIMEPTLNEIFIKTVGEKHE